MFPAPTPELVRAEPAMVVAIEAIEALQTGGSVPQNHLSNALDMCAADAVMLPQTAPQHQQSRLQLVSAVGAGAWLHLVAGSGPADKMDSAFLQVVLAKRLRMPLLGAPGSCQTCCAWLDVFLGHALVCQCRGDGSLRRCAARNASHMQACAARGPHSRGLAGSPGR